MPKGVGLAAGRKMEASFHRALGAAVLWAVIGGCSLLLPEAPDDVVDDSDDPGAPPAPPDGGGADGDAPGPLDDGRDSDLPPPQPDASPDAGGPVCLTSGRPERCGNCVDEDCVDGPAACGDHAITFDPATPGGPVGVEACGPGADEDTCVALRCAIGRDEVAVEAGARGCEGDRCCWSFEVEATVPGSLECTFARAEREGGECLPEDLSDRVCGRVEIEGAAE